jgi:hypothetical protein
MSSNAAFTIMTVLPQQTTTHAQADDAAAHRLRHESAA